MIRKPRRRHVASIRNFMLVFGSISSLFDCLTFVILLGLLNTNPLQFRTGRFVELVSSAAMIVLAIRTRRSILSSRPGTGLLISTVAVIAVTFLMPLTGLVDWLGFTPLPVTFYWALGSLLVAYLVVIEFTKKWFYGHSRSARSLLMSQR